jgi:hypothetical protein
MTAFTLDMPRFFFIKKIEKIKKKLKNCPAHLLYEYSVNSRGVLFLLSYGQPMHALLLILLLRRMDVLLCDRARDQNSSICVGFQVSRMYDISEL